jgi:GNAT superfamily N-acetyltransferase
VSSEVLAIERLGPGDVAGGLALSDAAGWNQNADDWSFFIAAGAAFGMRDDRGTLVATAAALPYDAATGWISMVLVAAAQRHRGIASQLVDACVASLRGSGRTPVLDATPAGAAVYAKIGFAAGFAFERWEGEVARHELGNASGEVARHEPGNAGGEIACHERGSAEDEARGIDARAPDAEALIDLDRRAGGVDRTPLWRAFLARPETRAWLAPRGDGFALRRAGRRAAQIGPVIAADAAVAIDLVGAALAGVAGRVFIDVPVHCTEITNELARRGFTQQRAFVRMALGDARAAAARDRVFALAGPEFG